MVTGQLAPKKKVCRPESTHPQVNSHPSNFISTLGGFYGASYIYFAREFYYLIIPPAYKVYRGYIVFAFSVRMFVCVSVNFFSVKDFSETT